jgi:hypothetical protein
MVGRMHLEEYWRSEAERDARYAIEEEELDRAAKKYWNEF